MGPLKVVHSNSLGDKEMRNIDSENIEVQNGGKWSPKCQARHKVSIKVFFYSCKPF